jgi:uncharacterized protein YkwD
VPVRRPAHVFLVLLLACVAPLGVVAATGLAGSPVDDDQVETAQDGGSDGAHRGRAGPSDGGSTAGEGTPGTSSAPGPTTTVTGTTPPTTAPASPSTAPPASPTTAPPPTPPPSPPSTPVPTTAPPPAPAPAPSLAEQVVALVNTARAAAGCAAVRIDARLAVAAQAHSDDMAALGYFSHTSLDGRSFADRITAAGYPSPGGENIAKGQRSAQAVHDAWMGSDGHRRNIVDCRFTAIGVGVNTSAWTWTQDFGY